jgi:hypothetical protein
MNNAQPRKTDDAPMSLEEIARRMLAMPAKQRTDLVKKKAKPPTKK